MEIKNGVLYNVQNDNINLGRFIIPENVKMIGYHAFANCTSLVEAIIPNSVIEIGQEAFYGCTSLKKIKIPNSVTKIGIGAFANCTSLVETTIPNSVTEIGIGAFANCASLVETTIPNSVTEISNGTFLNCSSLRKVEIPDSVTKIYFQAFQNCKSLEFLNISNNLKLLCYSAFKDCDNLNLNIDTSLFSIDFGLDIRTHLLKSKIRNLEKIFPSDTTIYGIKYNSKSSIPSIQKQELKDKINKYLEDRNITDKNGKHSKFINYVVKSYKSKSKYNYQEDFKKYMEDYIKKLYPDSYIKEQCSEENSNLNSNEKPEILFFDDNGQSNTSNAEIEQTLSVNASNNSVQNINDIKAAKQLNELDNYSLNELYEYANKLGLTSWVDKIKTKINISLLCGGIPKKYFNVISHISFIKEMLQCLSDDINYDYESAVANYTKNYIETHKLPNNEVTINTSENIEVVTNNQNNEVDLLKQQVEQLQQELLMLKKQSSNTKISLVKEPIDELSSSRKK